MLLNFYTRHIYCNPSRAYCRSVAANGGKVNGGLSMLPEPVCALANS
jgi:hypothetical protein